MSATMSSNNIRLGHHDARDLIVPDIYKDDHTFMDSRTRIDATLEDHFTSSKLDRDVIKMLQDYPDTKIPPKPISATSGPLAKTAQC